MWPNPETDENVDGNVGNKTKGRISKWVFQESKARQIFRKAILGSKKLMKIAIFNICVGKMIFKH